MKIKKIESICKADKSIVIFKNDTDQWLGDGEAMYKLDNMPSLDESTILTLFDVAEKEREKYFIRCSTNPNELFSLGYNFNDTDNTEQIIDALPIKVSYRGYTAIPFSTEIGALYVESRYIAPFHKLESGYELYVRYTTTGAPYIAVKTGLFLIAIILPCNTFFELNYVDCLNGLLTNTFVSRHYIKEALGATDDSAEPTCILCEAETEDDHE